MQKQRNKRRTDAIKLKFRNRKLKNNNKKWRKIKWRQIKKLYDAFFPTSDSYCVEDTTQSRAPFFYQAPNLSSKNPEEDFAKGMHIINHRIEEWYFDGKELLLKAANAGHARAQFMLGHFNLEGWDWFETPDINYAETWLTEAIKNGLCGEELSMAQKDLQKIKEEREWEWKQMKKDKSKPEYIKFFGRIYKNN